MSSASAPSRVHPEFLTLATVACLPVSFEDFLKGELGSLVAISEAPSVDFTSPLLSSALKGPTLKPASHLLSSLSAAPSLGLLRCGGGEELETGPISHHKHLPNSSSSMPGLEPGPR